MAKITVDVTPLLPGGINGGAKPMVVALLQELPRLLSEHEFTLFTADYSHAELASLDRPNLKRICIRNTSQSEMGEHIRGLRWFAQKAWSLAKRRLPENLQNHLRALYYQHRRVPITAAPLYKSQDSDFLFCPFGAPTFYDPKIPTLSIVYDLQFLDYPEFFTEQERFYRQLHFNQVCQRADHIVTISEFTRQSVLKNSSLQPEQVTTIHIGLLHDYSTSSPATADQAVLDHLSLEARSYLFYPANFWAHKNHKALLLGFQRFRQKHPDSGLKLVFTGALDERRAVLLTEVEKWQLSPHVVTPGFIPAQEIGSLYRNAKGLIFPSLYEGFGIPLLEAMQCGIPVACSNVTSLPEIGGDAVLFFDPRNIAEISDAIEALSFDERLCRELVRKGYERLKLFGNAQALAQRYGVLINNMLQGHKKVFTYGLHGLTADHWFQEQAYLTFPRSTEQRYLEFSLHAPGWMPVGPQITINESNHTLDDHFCEPGETWHQSLELPLSGGIIEMCFSSVYTPASLGIAEDHRPLSVSCDCLQVKSSEDTLLFDGLL